MGIFSRFTDIINANINALLDGAEDPAKMIRMIVREMEETLVDVRSSCARMIADKKTLQRRLALLEQEVEDWEAKATLAISKGREDLAKAALVEKKTVGEAVAAAQAELVLLDEHLDTLNDEVGQLQAKLDDAKAKQKTLMLRADTAKQRHKIKTQTRGSAVNNAFDKFELYERRLDEMEGQVEALDAGKKDLKTEIARLAEDEEIQSEIDRIKKSLAGK